MGQSVFGTDRRGHPCRLSLPPAPRDPVRHETESVQLLRGVCFGDQQEEAALVPYPLYE